MFIISKIVKDSVSDNVKKKLKLFFFVTLMTATKQEMGQTLSPEQEEMAFEGIADMLSNVYSWMNLKLTGEQFHNQKTTSVL